MWSIRRPGRGDEDVDAGGERLDLRPVLHAAEHDGDGEAHVAAVDAEALGDLAGQLAGRAEHQDAAAAARRGPGIGGQALQDRQGEGRGLAGAGLGDAQHVAPGEDAGDGLGLDGRGLAIALFGQRLQQGL